MTGLGRLTRIELRDIWTSEAQDFTPWLADETNLPLLSDTLGIELELEAVERNVGPFRADILCKDTVNGKWVLIENQLERSDHTHLGQLMTYAAGLDAVTIVWIAARIAEEHRAAIDWLNEITETEVRFFALEVELWKIADSPAAPKFNVVCKPNDWSRDTARARKAIAEGELTPARQQLLDYWTAFEAALPDHSRRVRPVKPLAQNWIVHGLGKSGLTLNTTWNRRDNWIRAEVYLTGRHADAHFRALLAQRAAIEAELGQPLTWYDLPASDRRIWLERSYPDVTDPAGWPQQHLWLATGLDNLHRVFHDRVIALSPDQAGPA